MSTRCIFLLLAVAAAYAFAAGAEDTVNVVALAPKVLYTDQPATVTITVTSLDDGSPVISSVAVSLGGSPVYTGITDTKGRALAQFAVPAGMLGSKMLSVAVSGLDEPIEGAVTIKELPLLLLETDKPIYKPGQTIHGRALLLANDLTPSQGDIEIAITDGKGIKVFKHTITANAFGVAPFELDLATELNLGTWKITGESGNAAGALDVRVERYVLPRFDVDLNTPKDYFLVDEPVTGTLDSFYFFGKPVDGTVTVRASRYAGVWEEYANYTGTLENGQVEFQLPPVGYVSGTHGTGGMGSVQLGAVVTDTSGHEERTTKLLTIVESPIVAQLTALDDAFVPDQPSNVLLVAKNPDNELLPYPAEVTIAYSSWSEGLLSTDQLSLPDFDGSEQFSFTAPEGADQARVSAVVSGGGEEGRAFVEIYRQYSPSASFLHLARDAQGPVAVGGWVLIEAFATHDATVYYDVFAGGRTVWSGYTTDSWIRFRATQQMVPYAKVVAYIINPNNEISADTLPLEVTQTELAQLDFSFDVVQALPGDPVQLRVDTGAEAMVGIAIVDESVYALNEGRLNMQRVFDELEARFMEPQVEQHGGGWGPYVYGANEVFEDAGLQLLTSGNIFMPRGGDIWVDAAEDGGGEGEGEGEFPVPEGELAEVTRVRQYFPETWLWTPDLLTGSDGIATVDLTAPDSITTWRVHGVATSGQGLGIGESEFLVFQEFFGEPDLPFAVTRGEQFPVRIQVFNYLDVPQTVQVELAGADWFTLSGNPVQYVNVDANSVGQASFLIQPSKVGRNMVEVTLRTPLRADAVRKEMLVEPEGTTRETVTNGVLEGGESLRVDTAMPEYLVPDSEKLLVSLTPSLVAQSIGGIEDLVGMPYGCGEQNMIFLAPDIEALRYLDAVGEATPEIRAKLEHFITTGYQRELTYGRTDGSFSAFGDSDDSGSLWLTAFVLDTFSGARDVTTIDGAVLDAAAGWILQHQKPGGAWEPVGFVHHEEMLGGVEGEYALTAFVTIALASYGGAPAAVDSASAYLGNNLTTVEDDPYALAISALALSRAGHGAAGNALDQLVALAISDGGGMHWEPHPIETTAYAALALMEEDRPQANDAIKWLASQRNGLGGYGGTQDTVMALKALMTAARLQTRNISLTVRVAAEGAGQLAEFTVTSDNFDVLQTAELPVVSGIEITAEGSGEVHFQVVRRYNVLLEDEVINKDMTLGVVYDADHVEVDDIVDVHVDVAYFGGSVPSGMMILDVGVPTGFAPVQESLDALVDSGAVSRVEVAGRKVILYIDGLAHGESQSLTFQVKALFPVRAVTPDSAAYAYYKPEMRAESQGKAIRVGMPEAEVDDDRDGLTNAEEEASGTNPAARDTDGDGFWDSVEVDAGTDPLEQDSHPGASGVSGDVNGDGKVNAIDIQLVINRALGLDIPYPADWADLNASGGCDALDVQMSINAALGR